MIPFFIGIGLALLVALFARMVGFDRDRAFYPVVLTVIASYYILFALMAGDKDGLWVELVVFAVFTGAAVLGFRTSLWIVAAGLGLHGVFDFTRHLLMEGSGVPEFWPAFCLGYDLAAPLTLAAILLASRRGITRYQAIS